MIKKVSRKSAKNRNILPISQAGDYKFNVNHKLLKKISNAYEKVIIGDLKKAKNTNPA
ncbi:MAG TPA: hypothetical protein VJ909_06415 [Prolixibacteraceae bacterium]|nr:hypothetical protein [Prolixibacteraceae bacterium]